ncbi:dihydroorotate dehydrogenase [Paenibacillus sp. 32O-W]|uniref:ZIP family metal transporter n=1 Tax=Paenibacillus sp. 32O-W TaxID=1695218 RepID=UPI000721AB2A|nr:ZIP family metal transporter [Paenibacillus sp. 32O-W]ALS29390.1 dihydroorotate dehydrogenase [Paenibacillus sp. 32O-W]
MWDWFASHGAVTQALAGTLFTWFMTAVGASLVFFTRTVNERFMDAMLGFAGGVMIAASYWSLLAPALEMGEEGPLPAWIPAATGFMLGGVFLWLVNRFLPHEHPNAPVTAGTRTGPLMNRRSTLLVLAITLHNIPEGLAVGVAFGAVAADLSGASLSGALALALGIGIQNFPEGTAVAMPLRREGMSRRRSFFYGQLSGMFEPIAAVVGAAAVLFIEPLLPYALSFAAGAMIFVVAEEVIPSSQEHGHKSMASMSLMAGFAVMMILDVALG